MRAICQLIARPAKIVQHAGMSTFLDNKITRELSGLSEKKHKALTNKLGIVTVRDAIYHLPTRYEDRTAITTINNVVDGQKVLIKGEVVSAGIRITSRNKTVFDAVIKDSTGTIALSWFRFNRKELNTSMICGRIGYFHSAVRFYRDKPSLSHPEITWDDCGEIPGQGLVPVYPLTEGLYSADLHKVICSVLEHHKNDIDGLLPCGTYDGTTVKISIFDAFNSIHQPPRGADVDALNAQQSNWHAIIACIDYALAIARHEDQLVTDNRPARAISDKNHDKLAAMLPFALTKGQAQAIKDIYEDLNGFKPMNRLIQGDVGCGKTMVALFAAYALICCGHQSAILAPTEILAQQHHATMSDWMAKLGVESRLLTASTPAKERSEILAGLRNGKIKFVTGTHSLLSADVVFYSLGIAIIDEQHRFGVDQRQALTQKTKGADTLHLSATPIPRSVAMAGHGIVDISIINEKPPGRIPTKTMIIYSQQRKKLYEHIGSQLAEGRQCYVILPLVEENEALELQDATSMHASLTEAFSNYSVGLVHGKLHNRDKELQMDNFKTNKTQILVSTTVVEVGVDVPNSNIIVIEHAERFGLSQLHQLRGRVGRGAGKSWCILVPSPGIAPDSLDRLKIMELHSCGFAVAEEDLRLRGPGDLFGTRQSGSADFRIAVLDKYPQTLRASGAIARTLRHDPRLSRLLCEALHRSEAMKQISA